MNLRDFIEMLSRPLMVILLILMAGTFLSVAIGEPTGNWSWRLNKLNLAREGNLATWFESVVFLICGLSFAMIGWSRNTSVLTDLMRRMFQGVALISCFFAADEMLQIHEEMGEKVDSVTTIFQETTLAKVEFSWILIYGPILLVGLALFVYIIRKQSSILSLFQEVPRAKIYLIVAISCVPAILGFEAIEGYLWSHGNKQNMFPFFEESFEVIALYSFIRFNTIIAKSHDL